MSEVDTIPVGACRKTMFHAGQGMHAAVFYFQQTALAALGPVVRRRLGIREPDLATVKSCGVCGERFPRR